MKFRFNRKKIIILIIVIVIMILTVICSLLYRHNTVVRVFFDKYIFRKNITENTLPKISVENASTFAFNDSMVSLEKNKLRFYKKNAEQVHSFDIEISSPIVQTCGKFFCIAEKNGSKVYLINNQNVVWQKDIEGKISNLTVNKNGYVALSISDTTYKTLCKVYNDSGTELFTTYLSKSNIIDSCISDDNKYLAIAETNFSGIAIQSNVKIISIEKALSNSSDTIQYNYSAPLSDLIVNIEYCNGNNLVCLYDNHVDLIKDNNVSEITNFKDANILFADINDKLIQIEKRNTGLLSSEFELQIIDVPYQNKTVYKLEKEPKSIEVFGNIIAINLGTEALFINNSGWLIKDYTASQEIHAITISNGLAGIIFKDKVEFLSI